VRTYPQSYDFASAVDIAAIKCAADDPVLQHQRTLLQLVRRVCVCVCVSGIFAIVLTFQGRVLSIEAPPQATPIALNLPVFAAGALRSSASSSSSKRWTKKVRTPPHLFLDTQVNINIGICICINSMGG